MLTGCSSNISLHPASRNFPIEMIELYERPGIKCASLTSDVNWVNTNVHAVFDVSLLSHADETKKITLFMCIFMEIVWPDVCDSCSCI